MSTSQGAYSGQSVGKSRAEWIYLAFLFAAYFFNSIDRSILGILAQPVKEELKLTDWHLGLLTGFAFTILYMTLGFPMARVADRGKRVRLLSICMLVWSAMTALCGMTTTFLQLCLCRAGVGVGEAGCLPASHSLVTDYFPFQARSRALSLFGLGLPVGGLVGMLVGGAVMDMWGWRATFFVVGLPGVIIALLIWLFVKEPVRGRFDAPETGRIRPAAPSFLDVATTLWRTPALRHIVFALTLCVFIGTPNITFLGPYLIRRFDLGYTEVGFIIASSFMLGSAISTFIGGLLTHWAGRFDMRWNLWIPAIGIALSAPMYVAAYAQSTWVGLAIVLFAASIVNSTYLAPVFAVMHNSLAPRGRATAIVITQFLMNLIGYSLGPLTCGAAIDLLASRLFHQAGNAQSFPVACPGGQAVEGGSAALDLACRSAVADATQMVMIAFLAFMIWPAWHFFLASRRMSSDGRAVDETRELATSQ